MSDSESEIDEVAAHAKSLKDLETTQPEFYEFLKENDQDLLNFEESENEDQNDGDQEEEFDDVELERGSKEVISGPKLAYIKDHIRENPSLKLCKSLISAFRSAVQQADGTVDKANMKNSDLFNDIIKLCLIDLVPALHKVMKLSTQEGKKKVDPTKSKIWKMVYMPIKSYLIDMLKLFSFMNDPSILTLLLKHVVHLIPFYSAFIKLSRSLIKRMISLWSGEEETVRVLSLIIIVRLTKIFTKEYLNQVLKEMYFSYIKNTKFTSPTTWPMINFMKRSLAEVYALNVEIAYEHSFIYTRQLAIHLRNALTTKKKESFQTVYNWQYVHCLYHWAHVFCRLNEHDAIKTLIYPLVQTIIGSINLVPTAKYIPLRFHLVKILMLISESTGVFMPVLPFILEVLTIIDFNKKSSFSIKPLEFSCALKVTKSQLLEAGYKDGCLNQVCTMLLDYLKIYSHTIGFPELALPVVLQIKTFTKQCRVPKYNQQLKAVLTKIEENSLFISEKRRLVNFQINDFNAVKRWEDNISNQGTPMSKLVKNEESVSEEKPLKKKRKHLKEESDQDATKSFTQQSRVPKYNQELKVLTKIEENSLFISKKQRLVKSKLVKNEESVSEEKPLKKKRKHLKEESDQDATKSYLINGNESVTAERKFKKKKKHVK